MAPRLIKSVYTYKKISVSKMCEKLKNGAECIQRYKKRLSKEK